MAPRDFSEDGAFGGFSADGNGTFGANAGGHGYGFDSTGAPSPWQVGDTLDPTTGRKFDFQPPGSTLRPGQSSRQGNTIFSNRSNTGQRGAFGEILQSGDWNPSQMNMGSIMHANGGPVMSYAEGGAIEENDEGAQPDRLPSYADDPGEEPTSEPAIPDTGAPPFASDVAQTSVPGGLRKSGEAISNAVGQGVQNIKNDPIVKRIVSYLMGEGGDHPALLDQVAAQVDPQGQMSADDRNLLAVGNAPSQEERWKLLQTNRVAYNAKQAFAYAALNGSQQKPGDLNAAVQAANQAASHVLDGSTVNFVPAQGGVTATVTSPGAAQPQVFNLSTDQFRKYLNVGGDGQWDRVMQRKIPGTLAALSQGQAGAVSRLDQMRPLPKPQTQAAAPDATDTSEAPPMSQARGPDSRAVRTGQPQAMDATQGDQPEIVGTHDSHGRYLGPKAPNKLGYDEQTEARSRAMFPGTSQEQERQAWMNTQEQQGTKNTIEMAKAKREYAVDAARIKAAGGEEVAKITSAAKERGWMYASDAKQAVAQIAADQKAAHDGNVDARARVESARKAIATKRMTAGTLLPEDEALEKALTAQGTVANQRPAQQQQAPQQQAPQQQGGNVQPAPADPGQRVVGQSYRSTTGKVGVWTGKGWQVQ